MSVQTAIPRSDNDIAAGASAALAEVLACLRDQLSSTQNPSGDSIGKMERSVLRAGDLLVANLLSFAGRQPLKAERLEMLPFLCSFADLLRHTLDQRINVLVNVERDCPPWIGDGDALQEALTQLVLNASNAMPKGGRLLLRVSIKKVDRTQEMTLDVIDTGTGMTAAVRHSAMAPFFTTKPNSPQSGMGLPAVAGFAAQSGGRMVISSTVGGGSTVTLKLPIAEQCVPTKKAEDPACLC
ncbi:signal transduction histidine kinase [Variovorax boronicumulans]|uniref:sensor histidine kinase n=1 Tax=Variovorax boronicumulans TaxID=436515 RepID=UPI0033961AFE